MNARKIVQILFLALASLLLASAVLFMFLRVSDKFLDADAQKEKSIRKDLDQMRKMTVAGEYEKAEKAMDDFFKKYGSVSEETMKKSGFDSAGQSREAAQFEAAVKEENRLRKFEKAISDAEKLSVDPASSPLALKEAEKALGLAKIEDEMFEAGDLVEKLRSPGSRPRPKGGLSDSEKARYSSFLETGKKCMAEEKFEEAVRAFDSAVSIQPTGEALEHLGRAAGMLETRLRNSAEKK